MNKIVITTDGRTTLARLFEGKSVVRSAEAKCGPSDTFDFSAGAKLAFDRLMEGKKAESIKLYCTRDYKPGTHLTKGKIYTFGGRKFVGRDNGYVSDITYDDFDDFKDKNPTYASCLVPLVKRPAKVGEWVIATARDGHSAKVNKPYKVLELTYENWAFVEPHGSDMLLRDAQYLVLDGYRPEAEYYNGKVVCVKSSGFFHTVGKVYTVKDGFINDDKGGDSYNANEPIHTLQEFNECQPDKFVEFKGE